MRVYAPGTLELLAAWVVASELPADAERYVAEDDSEDAEYAALEAAADASAELLEGPGRRVVVVAETPDADAVVPLRLWAAVHADAGVVDPSRSGDLPDLGWYAVQEIAALLG